MKYSNPCWRHEAKKTSKIKGHISTPRVVCPNHNGQDSFYKLQSQDVPVEVEAGFNVTNDYTEVQRIFRWPHHFVVFLSGMLSTFGQSPKPSTDYFFFELLEDVELIVDLEGLIDPVEKPLLSKVLPLFLSTQP